MPVYASEYMPLPVCTYIHMYTVYMYIDSTIYWPIIAVLLLRFIILSSFDGFYFVARLF